MLFCAILVACAPPPSPNAPGDSAAQPAAQNAPRGTLKVAWPFEPENLHPKLLFGSGVTDYFWTFDSTLAIRDFSGAPHPVIARELPTQANGDWVVNPDGTMVTTYRLRDNARWHDGAPLTARDFAFAYEVYLDREIPVQDRSSELLMSRVEARDDQTLVIYWKEPFIGAGTLGFRQLNPLASHLFEEKYRTNRATFAFGEEWTTAYIGSGPFKLEQWTTGSQMLARANRDWVLGAPKLDAVEIRFVKEPSAMVANLFSGEVDMINSPGIRAAEAALARDQWASRGSGYVRTWETRLNYLDFQHREVPNWQRAVGDVLVRRALIHAVDRQALSDAETEGLGSPADAFITRSDPLFAEADRQIARYPYDPARAAALLAEAGWRAPSPGATAVNASGEELKIDLWTSSGQVKTGTIMADNWKAAGVNPNLYPLPAALERDQELRANFPGTFTNGRTIAMENFHFTTKNFPTPENRFTGSNRGSFSDAEVDRLHTITQTSFDERERRDATVALLVRLSQLVGIGPMFYQVEVIVAKNAVRGPIGNWGPQQGITWNIYEWEMAS
jgi:peptide/nickel transport system substrate-binding protein